MRTIKAMIMILLMPTLWASNSADCGVHIEHIDFAEEVIQEETVQEEFSMTLAGVGYDDINPDNIEISPDLTNYDVGINITDEEYKELAQIIMAEAGGEDLDGKILVGNVIMNRVRSDEFPDDIISVIRQERNDVYQFSPVGDGRINTVVPSDDVYTAIDMILNYYDISQGALYFEACRGETWHSRNLELLFAHGGHKFYK